MAAVVDGEEQHGAGRVRRAAAVAIAAMVAGAGAYLVLVYPPGAVEFPMAVMAGLLAGAATGSLAVAAWPGWAWPSVGVRPVRLVGQIVGGFVRAMAVALRPGPVRGSLGTVRRERLGGEDAVAAANRAVVGWTRSLAADSYVVAFDGRDMVREHYLRAEER